MPPPPTLPRSPTAGVPPPPEPALPTPLPYDPSIEHPERDETAKAARLRALMRDNQDTALRLTGHATRGLHTKSHGLLEGELRVLDGLPPELAQGLFARPAAYPAILRLSSNRPDVLDDDIGVPRGLALKVIGVEGDRLPGSATHRTQDFVMVNQPSFTEPDLGVFVRNIRFVNATAHTGLAWKKALAAVLRRIVGPLKAVGIRARSLTTMGGHPLTHPLGETFFSQVPFRHGDHVAKYALFPVSPALAALTDAPLDLRGRPNGLREAVTAFFAENGAAWELRAQLRTDPATMPIENAATEWPESESPYVAVARITIPPQPAWSEARARMVDDGLAFSPWHGLEAHRPLGAVNRARQAAYAEGAAFRSAANRCPIHEPTARLSLPDDPPEVFGDTPGREGRRPRTPDARPGTWEAPMRDTARGLTAGALGGLAAGAVLSALMFAGARGAPTLPVRAARRAAGDDDAAPTTWREEAATHAAHLAVSILAGAGFGALNPGPTRPVASGLALGVGFNVFANLVAPAVGRAPLPWENEADEVARTAALHALYGVTTALAAKHIARRL